MLDTPDGRTTHVTCEVKSLVNARDIPALVDRLTSMNSRVGPTLVIARYLSPRTRAALAMANFSYLDATGNARIVLDDPVVFIEASGADSDPWRSPDRPTNSLRGRPAARVVRALIDLRPPWKVRELVAAAGTSLGSTVRTLEFLSREALIERSPTGNVTNVYWEPLLERWASDYDLTRKQRAVRLIEPRALTRVEDAAAQAGMRYALSGSLAARWRAAYAEPKLAVLYAEDLDQMRNTLALREADSGTNVLLIEPIDDLVFARTWQQNGITYAALSQVVVDLLAGPGRNPEEGKALLRWMRDNESQWRIGQ